MNFATMDLSERARRLRRLSWLVSTAARTVALMVGAALSLTTPPLLELAFAAMGRGASVAVTITPQQITGLVAGVACLALGHVMAEAADMRAELDEFV